MNHNLKLNLGCGNTKKEGQFGIDISPESNADIIRDIRKGLPFCDDSAVEIEANNLLEHLYVEEFTELMNECWRVLKKDGVIKIALPFCTSEGMYKDPTHKLFFHTKTFDYLEPCERQKQYGFKPWKILYNKRVNYSDSVNLIFEEDAGGGAIYCEMTPVKETSE